MENKLRNMICAALVALLLLNLFPFRAAADGENSLSVSIFTEDGTVRLNLRKNDGIWYGDVRSLAMMAHCETSRGERGGILSIYRPEFAVILYTAREGEYLALDDGLYVPFEACAFSLGLRFTRYAAKDGFYVTAMKTPKDLEKLLNQIFIRKNYQLWEVPAEGGWDWIVTETASRIWAMLPFVGNTSILDTATGMAEKERYDRALASIMASSGDFLDLVYSSSDMDKSLKKAGKILASSEKGIDFLWRMIENDKDLCKKMTDAGIFETVRSMFETGSNPYENAPGDFLRDYPAVANAFQVSYWLDRFAFYGMAVDGDEATVLAMKKALGASSNSYIRGSATRLYESQYGNQATLLEDIYSGYLYHLLSDSLSDAVKKGLYGDSSLMVSAFAKAIQHGIELYFDSPSISGISDATVYYSIYSSYAIELSDYYFRHRDDTADHTAMDLRAVGILYLNTAKACVEKCKFDESLSEATAAMDELINSDLTRLLEYGDQEYEPTFSNSEFIAYLDNEETNSSVPSASQPALASEEDIRNAELAYAELLRNGITLNQSSYSFSGIEATHYVLFEMNGDGIHEMIAYASPGGVEWSFAIFSFQNGQAVQIADSVNTCDISEWYNARITVEVSNGVLHASAVKSTVGYTAGVDHYLYYDGVSVVNYKDPSEVPVSHVSNGVIVISNDEQYGTLIGSPQDSLWQLYEQYHAAAQPPEIEPPTEPSETERPTEPPSLAQRCEPYLSLLREYLSYGEAIFYLVEIDSDDIPELVISPAQIHTAKPEVYTIRNGSLVYVGTFDGEYGTGLMFGQNRIISFHDDYENVYYVYDYYEGEATLLKSFSEGPRVYYTYEPEIVYRVDGQEVSAEEYRNNLLSWVDESDTFRYWPTFAVTEENIESFAADPYVFYPDCSNFRSGYIYLEPEELYFDAPGQTAQLDIICDPHSAAGYYLESSDYNVVTFDISGLVTAAGPGWAEITISMNGFTSTCRVYCNWDQ